MHESEAPSDNPNEEPERPSEAVAAEAVAPAAPAGGRRPARGVGLHVRQSGGLRRAALAAAAVAPGAAPVQGHGPLLGDMYARWTLDNVIELAYAVAHDFVNRPQLYQTVAVANQLVDFRMFYGTARDFPNFEQRQAMHLSVFGKSDSHRPDSASFTFDVARKKLVEACIAFAERVYDTGVEMLKDRVRSALVPLRSHLSGVAGASVIASNQQTSRLFEQAVEILRTPSVASVFGVQPAAAGWPLDSEDPNGAKLIAAITATLKVAPAHGMTQGEFTLLRRAASEGRRALTLLLADDAVVNANLEQVIGAVYTWGTSVRDFINEPGTSSSGMWA